MTFTLTLAPPMRPFMTGQASSRSERSATLSARKSPVVGVDGVLVACPSGCLISFSHGQLIMVHSGSYGSTPFVSVSCSSFKAIGRNVAPLQSVLHMVFVPFFRSSKLDGDPQLAPSRRPASVVNSSPFSPHSPANILWMCAEPHREKTRLMTTSKVSLVWWKSQWKVYQKIIWFSLFIPGDSCDFATCHLIFDSFFFDVEKWDFLNR